MSGAWEPHARIYDPVKIGSIDGTDDTPHDAAINRALLAQYKPNKGVAGDPACTVFVGRLNPDTSEDSISRAFDEFGDIKRVTLVRDIITGFSKCYAFVEYLESSSARAAQRSGHQMELDGQTLLVDYELERTLPGWVPRRLGGGFGGKKESGQLRFGCKDRPFLKPYNVKYQGQHGKPFSSFRPKRDDNESSPARDSGRGSYSKYGQGRFGKDKEDRSSRSESFHYRHRSGRSDRGSSRQSRSRSRSRDREKHDYSTEREERDGRY